MSEENHPVVVIEGDVHRTAHRQRIAPTKAWKGETWCGLLGEPTGDTEPLAGLDCGDCLAAIEEAKHGEQATTVRDVIRAAIDDAAFRMNVHRELDDLTRSEMVRTVGQVLTESGALLPEGWLPLTMRELETLRAEVRRLPFWQVRTTTGEDLMVLVKEALLANKDFPAVAALLRSGGAKREE